MPRINITEMLQISFKTVCEYDININLSILAKSFQSSMNYNEMNILNQQNQCVNQLKKVDSMSSIENQDLNSIFQQQHDEINDLQNQNMNLIKENKMLNLNSNRFVNRMARIQNLIIWNKTNSITNLKRDFDKLKSNNNQIINHGEDFESEK